MVVSRKPDDEVPQYGKELVCDGPDDGVYNGTDEVGIGLLDGPGEVDGHPEVGTGMPDERVFDGHPEVGTGMPGEWVCEGPAKVGTGMPSDGVCDGKDEVGNGIPGEEVRDGPDEVGNLHDEIGNGRHNEGLCDGPAKVDNLFDDGGNGTSRVTKRAADRPVERAAAEENDELVETNYEQEEEDIAADTYVDPIRDWDSLRNP
ncbi:hypothetical protein LWI28_022279 [Acer negundo]|uniref:Uncharacterized protein n=1 Tax=Acer negundo TaxID=4023 RepID=A0AAD5NIP0_ACENE|nr:hypothetical protein LWI28_022279 [Acer negundo]